MTKAEIEETARWTVEQLTQAFAEMGAQIDEPGKSIIMDFTRDLLVDLERGVRLTRQIANEKVARIIADRGRETATLSPVFTALSVMAEKIDSLMTTVDASAENAELMEKLPPIKV
ncbi:MAG: hypothetical protein J5809_05735 [Selenomonadaceae bacterium]|nr:hypothetical protein [Selenomonadaceae bacterium]